MTLGNQWNVSWVRRGHRSTDMTQALRGEGTKKF